MRDLCPRLVWDRLCRLPYWMWWLCRLCVSAFQVCWARCRRDADQTSKSGRKWISIDRLSSLWRFRTSLRSNLRRNKFPEPSGIGAACSGTRLGQVVGCLGIQQVPWAFPRIGYRAWASTSWDRPHRVSVTCYNLRFSTVTSWAPSIGVGCFLFARSWGFGLGSDHGSETSASLDVNCCWGRVLTAPLSRSFDYQKQQSWETEHVCRHEMDWCPLLLIQIHASVIIRLHGNLGYSLQRDAESFTCLPGCTLVLYEIWLSSASGWGQFETRLPVPAGTPGSITTVLATAAVVTTAGACSFAIPSAGSAGWTDRRYRAVSGVDTRSAGVVTGTFAFVRVFSSQTCADHRPWAKTADCPVCHHGMPYQYLDLFIYFNLSIVYNWNKG